MFAIVPMFPVSLTRIGGVSRCPIRVSSASKAHVADGDGSRIEGRRFHETPSSTRDRADRYRDRSSGIDPARQGAPFLGSILRHQVGGPGIFSNACPIPARIRRGTASARAFSNAVATGSREENAIPQGARALSVRPSERKVRYGLSHEPDHSS